MIRHLTSCFVDYSENREKSFFGNIDNGLVPYHAYLFQTSSPAPEDRGQKGPSWLLFYVFVFGVVCCTEFYKAL